MRDLGCWWLKSIATFLILMILFLEGPHPAFAAGFSIVKLVNGRNRPDLTCCVHFYIFYTPVISGNHVAFLSRNGPPDGVWSGDITTKALTKLAGLETPAPGGTGNFSAFYGGADTPLSIGGNTVTFFASDAAGKFGIYSVPVTGGTIRRVVTTATLAPDGNPFTELRRATSNGATVTFAGRTITHASGIYRVTIAGKNLATVIDDGTQLDGRSDSGGTITGYFGIYGSPVIAFGAIYFSAFGLFDPVTGPNAVFRSVSGATTDMADNATLLQSFASSHVRILATSAAAASNKFAFLADQPVTAKAGVFEARTKDFAAKLVTTNDTAPGTNKRFKTFPAMSYDDSGAAFVATTLTQTGTDQSIYFTAGAGQPIQKVAAGSKYYFPLLGNRSVSNGRIVFMDGSNFADTVYVAVPLP